MLKYMTTFKVKYQKVSIIVCCNLSNTALEFRTKTLCYRFISHTLIQCVVKNSHFILTTQNFYIVIIKKQNKDMSR